MWRVLGFVWLFFGLVVIWVGLRNFGFLLLLLEYGKLGLWESFRWSFLGFAEVIWGIVTGILGLYVFQFQKGRFELFRDYLEFLCFWSIWLVVVMVSVGNLLVAVLEVAFAVAVCYEGGEREADNHGKTLGSF